jgi:hypothetical protein
LGGRISIVMARSGTLRAHPQALQVIVPALRRHVLPPRFLGDPAGNEWTGPETATGGWSLHTVGQLLQVLGGEQGGALGRNQLKAMVPEAGGTIPVVATHDATGVVFLQADEGGSVLGGLAIGDQGEELPASCFDQGGSVTRALAQLSIGEMGMEVGSACHVPAYHSRPTSCGFRIRSWPAARCRVSLN